MDLFTPARAPVLQLDLLGPPEVHFDGHPLTFRTKKSLALLVYLAVTGGSQPREHLATLLWPDSAETAARATLRSTVRFVRQALADIHATHASESLLYSGVDRMGREALWLQATPASGGVILDLQRVERSVTLAHHVPTMGGASQGEDHLTALMAAVEGCRGSFLEGFFLSDAPLFEDWITRQRSYWQGRVDQLFAALCGLQLQRGAFAPTAEIAERWLRMNPLQEAAYCSLMEAQAGMGERDAALMTYARCRQTLLQVLGVEPIPETVALAERLRATMRSHALPAEAPPPARRAPGWQPSRAWHALEMPLVGRMNEFAALVAAFERAQRGVLQVVVLTGEAGIGKTRLAREFLQWGHKVRGAEILRGRAFETGGRLPYQPLTEALRARLEGERAPEDLLDDVWLAELSRVLPDLRERYPDLALPTLGEDGGAQGRLFEAMAQLGLALLRRTSQATGQSLILFLDDLQWADVGTLDLLRFLIRRWHEAHAHVLLMLAVRQEEVQTSGMLREWLRSLAQEADDIATTHITLDPFDATMLRTLVDEVFVATAENPPAIAQIMPAFVNVLYEETNGLPLYLVQMLRALLERGVLLWDDERAELDGQPHLRLRTADLGLLQGIMPTTLRAVIQGRMERLAPPTRRLLTAGAVLGTRFQPEHAWALAELDEVAGVDGLEEAERSMVVRPLAGGATYEFTHDKMHNVLYDEMGMVRRKVLHRRALALLEQSGGATAAELAHHALLAGLETPAFKYSLEAGDVAMQVFAVRDAIGHYEHALHLITASASQFPGPDHDGQGSLLPSQVWEHLHTQLGRAYEWRQSWDEARAIYQAQRAYAREHGARTLEASTLTRMAQVAREQSWDLPTAQSLAGEALALVEGIDDNGMLAETHWTFAQLAELAGEHTVALPHAEQALALARTADQRELVARSLLLIAQITMQQGAWGVAAGAVSEARARFAALAQAAMLNHPAPGARHQHSESAAEAVAAQFLFAGSLPSTTAAYRAMEAICLAVEACVAINRGTPLAGIAAGRDALEILQQAPNTHIWGQAAYPLAMGLAEIGHYEEALHLAQQGVAAAHVGGDPYALSNACMALVYVWHALGQPRAAQEPLQEAIEASERLLAPYWIIPPLSSQCANNILLGDQTGAYAAAQRVGRLREVLHTQQVSFDFMRHYETEALLQQNDLPHAQAELQRLAEQISEDQPHRRHRLVLLRMQGLLALQVGNMAEAEATLREALAVAEAIGLPGEQWQIHTLLGDLYQQQERQEAADELQSAITIVHDLARNIHEKSLREKFRGAALRAVS